MDTTVKIFLLTLWCSILLPKTVNSQRYLYKHKDVNQYEIRNGKYRLIPTTTRPPTLMETFFPWTGNAYNSVRTPEEDAAILNSLSDPEPTSTSSSTSSTDNSLMSWFSLPGFRSTGSGTSNESPSFQPPMRPNYPHPPMNFNSNMPLVGASSQNEPVVVAPPVTENQISILPASPPSPVMPQNSPLSQYPAPPESYAIPHEIRNNVNPTFQFHQQVKDSIPIPSPSLPGFGQSVIPYPYSAGGNLHNLANSTTEKSTSILEVLSNYFTFGKRSDFDGQSSTDNENAMQARSMNGDDEYEAEDDGYEVEFKEAPSDDASLSDSSLAAPPSTDSKAFPCPKSGIWRWNGEVCIAVGPVPVWACRPNDLTVSGKIAICRNKIYFSPKVINNGVGQKMNQ